MPGHSKWSEIKRVKGIPDEGREEARAEIRRAEAAWTSFRQRIAGGERPRFHVHSSGVGPSIEVRVIELPWLAGTVTRPTDALDVGRALIADWLDVTEDDFVAVNVDE